MISQVLFSFFSHFIYKRNRQNVTPFESSGLLLSMERQDMGQSPNLGPTQRLANGKLETNSNKVLYGEAGYGERAGTARAKPQPRPMPFSRSETPSSSGRAVFRTPYSTIDVRQTRNSDENTFEPSLVEFVSEYAVSSLTATAVNTEYALRSSIPDFIRNTSGANISSMTPRESTGRNTREQSIFTAYKKRNISRLVFLFSENGITTLYKIFLEIEEYLFNVSTSIQNPPTNRGLRKSQGATDSLRNSIHARYPIQIEYPMNSQSKNNKTSNSYAPFRKFASKLQRPLALLICIIPYVIILGFLLTLTSFKLSRYTVGPRPYCWESSMASGMERQDMGQSHFRVAKLLGPTQQATRGPSPCTHDLYSYEMNMNGACANTAIHSGNFYIFAFEILRFANYASKIFVLWAFFNIWRGIRPGQSIRNEYTIQTRMLTIAQNRKSFQDVEGIEKFLPILRTLVQSLQKYSSFSLSSIAFKFGIEYGKYSQSESNSQPKLFPKGYLFIGPPGTGKTLLAQAVAGEAGVKLICLSASEIQKQIESGTRIGAIRLRNLFKQARKNTPCILFLDEIDSIGKVPTDMGEAPFEYGMQDAVDDLRSSYATEAGYGAEPFSRSETPSSSTEGRFRTPYSTSNPIRSTSGTESSMERQDMGQSRFRVAKLPRVRPKVDSVRPTQHSTRGQRIKNNKLALFSAIGGEATPYAELGKVGRTKAVVGHSPYPGAKPSMERQGMGQSPNLGPTQHQASPQFQSSLHLSPTVREYNTVQFREANTTSDYASGESCLEKVIERGFAYSQSETTALSNQYERTSTSSGNRTCDITLLTEFLIQMDSFSSEDGFLVIGTTNFLPNLDTAFIRSGRFDRIIGLQFPGKQTRIGLLKLYGKKQGVDPSISWDFFGKKTKGLSAADLSKVMNESSLYLIEKYLRTVSSLTNVNTEYVESSMASNSTKLDCTESSMERQDMGQSRFRVAKLPQVACCASRILYSVRPTQHSTRGPIYLNWIRQVLSNKQQKLLHTSESIEKGIEKISTREKFVS